MQMTKSNRDKGSPWRKPLVGEKVGSLLLFHKTIKDVDWTQLIIKLINRVGKSISWGQSLRKSQQTLSYVFIRSIFWTIVPIFLLSLRSLWRISWRMIAFPLVILPFKKAAWAGEIYSYKIVLNFPTMILVKILKITLHKVIGCRSTKVSGFNFLWFKVIRVSPKDG